MHYDIPLNQNDNLKFLRTLLSLAEHEMLNLKEAPNSDLTTLQLIDMKGLLHQVNPHVSWMTMRANYDPEFLRLDKPNWRAREDCLADFLIGGKHRAPELLDIKQHYQELVDANQNLKNMPIAEIYEQFKNPTKHLISSATKAKPKADRTAKLSRPKS